MTPLHRSKASGIGPRFDDGTTGVGVLPTFPNPEQDIPIDPQGELLRPQQIRPYVVPGPGPRLALLLVQPWRTGPSHLEEE